MAVRAILAYLSQNGMSHLKKKTVLCRFVIFSSWTLFFPHKCTCKQWNSQTSIRNFFFDMNISTWRHFCSWQQTKGLLSSL